MTLARCRACGHRFAAALGFHADSAYQDDYAGFTRDPVFEESARRFFAHELSPKLPKGARVLDVGCGNGTVLDVAGRSGFRATGIDVSEAAVRGCVERGFDAVQGDFTTFDFGSDPFDAVMFWDVLEHLERPSAFVERAAEILRPGGWLLAKVPGHRELSILLAAYIPRLAGALLQVPHHLQLYSRESLTRLLGHRFDRLDWLEVGAMRGQASGGTPKRRAARRFVRAVHLASGDSNLTVLARKG